MMSVDLTRRSIDEYRAIVGDAVVDGLRAAAQPLDGLRVLHVNSTKDGGGVAEILRSMLPLLNDLGLECDWQVISAPPDFYEITKRMHNGLQGGSEQLRGADEAAWTAQQVQNAAELHENYDVVVVHDPQPLGLAVHAGPRATRWIWRLHVDSSEPQPNVWAFLAPHLEQYDALVFTLPAFVQPGVPPAPVRILAPAIDPLTPKNRPIERRVATAQLRKLGIDPRRPFMAQVSRLDPWKDPIGVIDAFRLVRADRPGLQLVLLGAIEAADDPEALRVAEKVRAHAAADPDIHVLTDAARIGPNQVSAVQALAAVVLQKSLKEGFGLTVSEALWKGRAVVAGRVGGIPLQVEDGVGGFLVDSVEAAAERTGWLLANPDEAERIGALGRERVRERFLLTRLLADELALYGEVLNGPSRTGRPSRRASLA